MKQEEPSDSPDVVEGEIVSARRGGISWAWLFPILALAATSWLFWSNWKAKGPEISIHFTTAPGIEPGKTVLIYRGVQAGTVSDVRMDHDLGTVVVSVSLKAFARELATEGTDYWIEQPVISLHEIAGLESIIQGNSIHARTHGDHPAASVFKALEEAPLAQLDSADLSIRLHSTSIPFLDRGTPVFHRGVNVGEVRDKLFNADDQPEVEVIIFEKYADKVRANSRFWAVSATAVSASPGVVRLDIPSLQGLVGGSIAFDQFGPAGDAVKSGTEFELSSNETAARAEGPRLNISFAEGAGLRAGETRITFLGQPVGLVEQITADPANKRVGVVARLDAAFAALASEDSVFTITRPNINMKGISGLDTLVTGPCIAFEPGKSKVSGSSFVGNETPQIDLNFGRGKKEGTRVVLRAKSIPQLKAGAPVYHHGMIAGEVIEQRIGSEGLQELVITVDSEFQEFLRVNTRFWRVPAAVLAVGPGMVGVEIQGLSAFLQGGLMFDTFGPPGPAAPESAGFELHASEQLASAISDPIRIELDDGQGLVAGKTEVRYLGVPVGIVESVRTTEAKVEATARFQPGYDFLRRKGSEFAVVRPEIDLKGAHGLDALAGVYITCAPGGGSEYAEFFSSVPQAAPALLNEPGFEIILETGSTKIDAGAPISYNDTPVGEVIAKTLSHDGKRILLTARIRDEHSNLVRANSVFWDATSVDAKIGFLKVEIDTPSVLAPNGRISFHTPDNRGGAVKENSVFALQSVPPAIKPETEMVDPPKAPRTWKR
ncbi:MAG: MlaD family protein [Luteolibacter sp.]|uniref:MlaD family protein n=1 Tax=Luteolibacter sp. TaxID=1962973 RepID=UPI0032639BF6